MATKSENRRINLYINGKEVKNDIRSIRNEYFKMINEQSRMLRNSKEYYQHAQGINQLKGILDQHSKQLGRVGKAWQSIKQIMLGVVGGNILTSLFQRITMAIPNLIGSLAKLSDKFADVSKTTGLTTDQVKELHKEFKSIDTRTSRKELLDLARVAGKLGITGRKDIFDFVKAADQIKVALSEDLGGNAEDAINHIGKLVDVFKLKDKFSLEDSMLKTGSAINALGAASTASEGYLVEFSKRVAGVAPLAKISIENVLGLAATLDQLGQASEVSSTVYSQVVPDMFKDTATYAEVAGMKVEEFSNLLNTDANEAFIKVLEGLNGNNGGLQVMVEKLDALGIEGKRSIGVLGVLSNNTELLRDQQKLSNDEFEKGTSLTEEFNKKNENMAANLEKIGKWINGQFMNSGLMTFFENLVNKAAEYVKIPVSETMEVERMKANALAIEMTNINITAERRNEIYNELKDIAPDIVAGIDAENISTEKLRLNLAKYNDEMIKKIAIQESEETLADTRKDYGLKIGERLKAEAELTSDLIKMKENVTRKDAERAEKMNEILLSDKDILEKEKEIFQLAIKETSAQEGGSILTSNKIITGEKVRRLRADELKLQEEMNAALKVYTDLYNKVFGISGETPSVPGAPISGGGFTPKPGKGTKTVKDKFDPSKIGSDEISSIIELNKQKQEAYKESREQIIIDLDKSYQEEANLRQIAHNEELAALGTKEEERKALDEKFKQEELLRQVEHLKKVIAESQKILDAGGIEGSIGSMLTDEEKESLISKIQELKVQVSELSAEASGIDADGNKKDIFGMTEDEWDTLFGKMQVAMETAYQLGEIWTSVNQRIANQENEGLRRYESNADKKKQALEKQLKKGLISEKKYNDEIAAIDLRLDEEKKKIEIAQAKRARTAAIFGIAVNTLMAIMKIWADVPKADFGVSTIILSALALGIGLASLAALPPVPTYAKGGYTKGDKMYRAGEEGKEWIAPNWMAEHPYIGPVIRNLENVRAGAAPETIFRSPAVPEYNSTSTSSSSAGGASYQSTNSDSILSRIVEQNDELLQFYKDPENRKSYIRYDDLTKYSKEIQTMQELSGF